MGKLATYIFSVICASGVCAIIAAVVPAGNTTGKLMRIVCGVFMVVTFLSPVMTFDFDNVLRSWKYIQVDATNGVICGQEMSEEALSAIIIDKSQAYILQEANRMDISIEAMVELSDENPPVPYKVVILGNVSPYHKQLLGNMLKNDLGILQENIIWQATN